MNTNDSNNPQNTGTGAGANYGSSNTGTGMGNSTGLSNEGTSYNAGTGVNVNNSTSGNTGAPDDFSATQKGAAIAGTAGAVVGRGIDAVQNTARDAAQGVENAVSGTTTGQGTSTTFSDASYREGSTMTGMFKDRNSAERAYSALHERGYSKDDVNLLMSDETRKTHFGDGTGETELGDKAMEGAGIGSAIGGTAGAIIGAIAAIGTSVALPGLGLIVAGPLAAALAGAGAGGLTGGLVGALVGSGIPEEHAAEYEQGIQNGGIVMGVKPRNADDARYLEEQFRASNADKVHRY